MIKHSRRQSNPVRCQPFPPSPPESHSNGRGGHVRNWAEDVIRSRCFLKIEDFISRITNA